MRDWTDEQFRKAGWKWVLRDNGRAMACTVSVFDAAQWTKDRAGEVVDLHSKERPTDG